MTHLDKLRNELKNELNITICHADKPDLLPEHNAMLIQFKLTTETLFDLFFAIKEILCKDE